MSLRFAWIGLPSRITEVPRFGERSIFVLGEPSPDWNPSSEGFPLTQSRRGLPGRFNFLMELHLEWGSKVFQTLDPVREIRTKHQIITEKMNEDKVGARSTSRSVVPRCFRGGKKVLLIFFSSPTPARFPALRGGSNPERQP